MDDSTYIGKATFKRNQFTRSSHKHGMAGQNAHMKSLRRNYEDMEKMGAELDRMLNEKKEVLRQCKLSTEWPTSHAKTCDTYHCPSVNLGREYLYLIAP